ncbi:MAG: phosphodiester glycosidase family protein [Oscillospiraceae bacterium]|nr:phosphodiester glycosidase family protein [Oscillospiraceae bacterium]
MRFSRIRACAAAAMLLLTGCGQRAAADTGNAALHEYDPEGFAWKWPEKFSEEGTVNTTADSYQSHDLNIQLSRHFIGRLNGDVNHDQTVDITDAVLSCRLLAEDAPADLSAEGMLNADCDNDGNVTLADTNRLMRYLKQMLTGVEFFTNRTVSYVVADVYVRDIRSLRGAFAKGTFPEKGSAQLESISKMAEDNNAVLAINCDYCEIRSNGITCRNGVMYRDTARAEVAVIYQDGVMDVLTDAEYRALMPEQVANIWQTTSFAPGLVKDGVQMSGFSGSTYTDLHPRSGIGYFEPGHYCFVQVDGRQPGYSDGVSVAEFAEIMFGLGVQEGYNMDGGSSSEVVFLGQTYNHPSGIKTGSTGGRKNSDILFFCNLDEIPEDTAAAAWFEAQNTEVTETTNAG